MSTQIDNTGDGLHIGRTSSEKIGFFGATPVAQFSPAQTTNVGISGAGTAAYTNTAYVGFGTGSTNVTVNDIVTALKKVGILPL